MKDIGRQDREVTELPMHRNPSLHSNHVRRRRTPYNYELQKPIETELYELFRPFGYLNYELGNERLGEV